MENKFMKLKPKIYVDEESNTSYIYVPYTEDGYPENLRLMTKDGHCFINLRENSNGSSPVTYAVLDAHFVEDTRNAQNGNHLLLKTVRDGEVVNITLPIFSNKKDLNIDFIQTVNTILKGEPFESTQIEKSEDIDLVINPKISSFSSGKIEGNLVSEINGNKHYFLNYDKTKYFEVINQNGQIFANISGLAPELPSEAQTFQIVNVSHLIEDDKPYTVLDVYKDDTYISLKLDLPTDCSVYSDIENLLKNQPIQTSEIKSEQIPNFDNNIVLEVGPALLDGNLCYVENDTTYFMLPTKNGDQTNYLTAIQKDGATYINLLGLDKNNPETPVSFKVNEVAISKDSSPLLVGEIDGQEFIIALPLENTLENTNALEAINALISEEFLSFTKINQDRIPAYTNLHINSDNIKSNNIEFYDTLKKTKRTGQSLVKEIVNLPGKEIVGLSQEIDTKKINLRENQKFSVLDSSEILAVVSKTGESPVAYFEKDNDNIYLNFSKELLDSLNSANPLLDISEGINNGDFVKYEINKLKLSKDLNLEDIQLKGANKNFAVMFSALGCQIKDKDNHLSKVSIDNNKPFNIAVSNQFLKQASSLQEAKCQFSKEEPSYSALLISALQLERSKIVDEEKQLNPLKIDYIEGCKLISLPIIDKKGNLHYLNLKEEDGKKSIYIQTASEKSNAMTAPKFYSIDEIGLWSNKELSNTSLFMGLSKNVATSSVDTISIDMDFNTNANSLIYLKDFAQDEFTRCSLNQKNKLADVSEITLKADKNVSFNLYPTSAESYANIISYDKVSTLSRFEEKSTKTTAKTEGTSGISTYIPDPIRVEGPQTPSIDSAVDFADINLKDPEERKTEPEKKGISPFLKIAKWNGLNKYKSPLIGLFVLSTLFSVFLPALIPVSTVLLATLTINEVAPWKILGVGKNAYDTVENEIQKSKNRKKEFEKAVVKNIEKDIETSYSKINASQSVIVSLEQDLMKIENNPKLTEKEKALLKKELVKKIEKEKQNIEKNKTILIQNQTLRSFKEEQSEINLKLKNEKNKDKVEKIEEIEKEKQQARERKHREKVLKEKAKRGLTKEEKDELANATLEDFNLEISSNENENLDLKNQVLNTVSNENEIKNSKLEDFNLDETAKTEDPLSPKLETSDLNNDIRSENNVLNKIENLLENLGKKYDK